MSRAALGVPTHGSRAPDSRSQPRANCFASAMTGAEVAGAGEVFVSGKVSVELRAGQASDGGLARAHPARVEADDVEPGPDRGGDLAARLQRVADPGAAGAAGVDDEGADPLGRVGGGQPDHRQREPPPGGPVVVERDEQPGALEPLVAGLPVQLLGVVAGQRGRRRAGRLGDRRTGLRAGRRAGGRRARAAGCAAALVLQAARTTAHSAPVSASAHRRLPPDRESHGATLLRGGRGRPGHRTWPRRPARDPQTLALGQAHLLPSRASFTTILSPGTLWPVTTPGPSGVSTEEPMLGASLRKSW